MSTETRPRPYVRPMPATWWLHNRYLFLFMVRELTAVFVGGYALFLLLLLYRFAQGPERFHAFFENTLQSPWVIGLQVVALLFVLYHTVTTCNAAPVLMTVWRGEEKVDPRLIIGANYAVWLILSLLIILVAI